MAGIRSLLYTIAKLMGDYNAVKKGKEGGPQSGPPSGRQGHWQGYGEAIQIINSAHVGQNPSL